MRRLLLLLAASGLLALHHGAPMADASSDMAGEPGSTPMSAGMTLLCAGVIASAADLLRRVAARAFRFRAGSSFHARFTYVATRHTRMARGRPPPRSPALALLCVNQR